MKLKNAMHELSFQLAPIEEHKMSIQTPATVGAQVKLLHERRHETTKQ